MDFACYAIVELPTEAGILDTMSFKPLTSLAGFLHDRLLLARRAPTAAAPNDSYHCASCGAELQPVLCSSCGGEGVQFELDDHYEVVNDYRCEHCEDGMQMCCPPCLTHQPSPVIGPEDEIPFDPHS